MNKLSVGERARILGCLVEGNSIRATVRMTGAAKNTVAKLLADAGEACWQWHNDHARNLACKRVQMDEIWSFCYAKEKNLPPEKLGVEGFGDVWTWIAMDADTKFAVAWLVGEKNIEWASSFVQDIKARVANRIQLTSDGHRAYLEAVDRVFGNDVDYAMLNKIYGVLDEHGERKYSPARCLGARKDVIKGRPDPDHVSTSYVERSNLTLRMSSRRFTRLTNAFSKKIENHRAAVSLHFMHYNLVRIHQTLRVTPAMEAGVADHVWSLEEIASLAD